MKLKCLVALVVASFVLSVGAAEKIKVLLIDGENNHNWRGTTPELKAILDNAGIFSVDVSTTPQSPAPPRLAKDASAEQKAAHAKNMESYKAELAKFKEKQKEIWHPKFKDYAVVVSNYNGNEWPEDVKKEFVDFMKNGGGLVSVHAADNSFSNWPEYNEMIGLGGWGGRSEKSGPYLKFQEGKFVKDMTPGSGGTHGKQHEFLMEVRDAEHPIMKGLPVKWRHAKDELYAKLRGPANNLTVLASAFSDKTQGGTGLDEPLLMVISYEKGRVFHTALGHAPETMQGVGFQVTLARGTEWAATGNVTLPNPPAEDLPADHPVMREPVKK
ncbi:MAG: ThuA domain-containing protein [Planctomycetota bacterium]